MSHIIIVGCGIVGATIAYELTQIPGLKVTVLDQQPPAQEATGAALGVLMGIVSQKVKGKAWKIRQESMERYETLIPELERITGHEIPFNRQGILMLCLTHESLGNWAELVSHRQEQGYPLEMWDKQKIYQACPHLNLEKITAGIYSPRDRQLDPTLLTLALVEAGQKKGVDFQFNVRVFDTQMNHQGNTVLKTSIGDLECDWVVMSAGLGSSFLTNSLKESVDIRPVLGQALHLRLESSMGNPKFQPVITGNDVHIVPCLRGNLPTQEYWIGATVEFPARGGDIIPDHELLDQVLAHAISFCPSLENSTILRKWSGLRPRPEGKPAPVIGQLPGYDNVLMATGHYRNGILLAPGTARAIREMINNG